MWADVIILVVILENSATSPVSLLLPGSGDPQFEEPCCGRLFHRVNTNIGRKVKANTSHLLGTDWRKAASAHPCRLYDYYTGT